MFWFLLDMLKNQATQGQGGAGGMLSGLMSKDSGGGGEFQPRGEILSKGGGGGGGMQVDPEETELSRRRNALLSKGINY